MAVLRVYLELVSPANSLFLGKNQGNSKTGIREILGRKREVASGVAGSARIRGFKNIADVV